MPKIEGRTSTKPEWPIERLAMASFFMPWERRYAKRKCFVKGCDHRIENCVVANQQPGIAVDLEQYERDLKDGTMKARSGPVCECCVNKILAQEPG